MKNHIQPALQNAPNLSYPSYTQLQTLFDVSADVICSIDANGIFKQVSKASLKIWGYQPEELVGRPYMNLVMEEDHLITQEVARSIMQGLSISHFENRYRCKDGSIVPLIWSAQWDAEEGIMVCIAKDASEKLEKQKLQIKLEKEIKEQNRQMNEMLERMADGVFGMDNDWRIVYANSQVEKILCIKREDYLSRNFWECFPSMVDTIYYKQYHKAMQTKQSVHFEAYFEPFNKWFAINAYPSSTGLSVFFQDVTQQHTAAEALHISNERFRLASKSDAIYDWDLASNRIMWGEGLKDLFGYEPDDLQINKWETFLHIADRQHTSQSLYTTLENKTATFWEAEYRLRKKDTSFCYVLERGYILRDSQGKALRMVGKMQDISESKRIEAERTAYKSKIEEQHLTIVEVLEQMGTAFITMNWGGEILYWNKEAEHLSGVPRKAILGKNLGTIYPGVRDSIYYDMYVRLKSNNIPIHTEVLSPFTNRWVEVHAYTTGKGISVFFSDISTRKKSEEEIRRLSLIAKETVNSVVITTLENKISWVNEAFTRISGYTLEEAVGKAPGELLDGPKTSAETLAYISDQQKKGKAYHTEIRNYSKAGEQYWSEVYGQPLLNEKGAVFQFFSIETNITARKKLEQEIRQQQNKINAAVITAQEAERAHVGQELHDNVNQVLTTVKLYQELCLSGIESRDELTKKSIDLIQVSINEIRSLSKRLSAPSLGNIKLSDSVKDLIDAIGATDKFVIFLDISAIENLEVDQATHLALYRILQEQMTNILKHAGADSIEISFDISNNLITMKVVDHGQGFDVNQKGAGIGLSNIKTRAESLKGTVTVTSTRRL
ncbi:MAG: PAS domain S-box protein [Chitinophagaceae bacterium]